MRARGAAWAASLLACARVLNERRRTAPKKPIPITLAQNIAKARNGAAIFHPHTKEIMKTITTPLLPPPPTPKKNQHTHTLNFANSSLA